MSDAGVPCYILWFLQLLSAFLQDKGRNRAEEPQGTQASFTPETIECEYHSGSLA